MNEVEVLIVDPDLLVAGRVFLEGSAFVNLEGGIAEVGIRGYLDDRRILSDISCKDRGWVEDGHEHRALLREALQHATIEGFRDFSVELVPRLRGQVRKRVFGQRQQTALGALEA